MPSDTLPPSRWLAGLAIALLACGGCRNDVDLSEKRFKCEDDSDCFAGHTCVDVPDSDGKACAPVVGGMGDDGADAGPVDEGCIDFDGDGFPRGNCGKGRDCADGDDQIHPGAEERCNGLDDNCNGKVDEECECTPQETQSCFSGAPGSQGTGVCTAGEQTCQVRGTWGTCEGMTPSSAERCDGKDNDCDGRVDENLVRQCGTREGGCDYGEQRCVDGEWSECTIPSAPDLEEECGDEQDNDCDGVVDEGCPCTFSGATGDEGVCAEVTRNEMGKCERPDDFVSDPTTEQGHCDEKDNNCNGIVDERCPCNYAGKSAGVCAGLRIDRRTGECPEPPDYDATDDEAAAGLCDGKDNDCDGTADENCSCSEPGERESFYSGPAGTEGVGICQAGVRECTEEGSWTTERPEQTPKMQEMCNNTDDDCDGREDENLQRECYSGPQGTAAVGICQKGTQRCLSGNWRPCDGERTPAADEEQDCNDNLDGDCDGQTDEGCACPYKRRATGVCGQSQTEDGGACAEPADYESTETSCADSKDNDCDGGADLEDSDCLKEAGESCTQDDDCLSKDCDSGQCAHRLFVSSVDYNGDLNGLSGADQKCNNLAGNAGLTGNWKAILSSSNQDARGRLTLSAGVSRMDGQPLASNASELWDASRDTDNPIVLDETGSAIDTCSTCDDDRVWTGSRGDGTAAAENCNDWQSLSPGNYGRLGDASDVDDWLYDPQRSLRCHQDFHIYCIDGQ